MDKTVYTALIEAEDGIHIFHKAISDPAGEYEDFEYAMQNKADDLEGELFGPYSDEDIVEDVTIQPARYHIKPEYFDNWFTKGDTPDPDYIVTEDELHDLANEWETPVEELLDQLIPID